jgi:hypothetical protein
MAKWARGEMENSSPNTVSVMLSAPYRCSGYREAGLILSNMYSIGQCRGTDLIESGSNPDPKPQCFNSAVLGIRIRRIHLFLGPPKTGSGTISTRYGFQIRSFYDQAKIVRKILFLLFWGLLL